MNEPGSNSSNDNHQERKGWSRIHDMPAIFSAFLSLIIPGLGQFLLGERARGIGFFLTVVLLGGLIAWQANLVLLIPLLFIWLWGAWDAYRLATSQQGGRLGLPILMAIR